MFEIFTKSTFNVTNCYLSKMNNIPVTLVKYSHQNYYYIYMFLDQAKKKKKQINNKINTS